MSRAHQKRDRGGGRRVSTSAPVTAEKQWREPGLPQRFLSLSPPQQFGLLLVMVVLLVLVIYWPALSAHATYFDDEFYLADRVSPSWEAAGRAFTEVLEPTVVVGYYHPLSIISIMLDRAWGGSATNLRPFHLTSLALHLGNTVLVMVLLYLLFGQPWVAAILGLLFGIHPVTVESIPWITERKTLLGTFFTLGSLVLYVLYARRKDWKLYVACFIAYLLAVLSKPTSLPAPALMLLLDYWPLRRLDSDAGRGGFRWGARLGPPRLSTHLQRYLEKAPFFILGGVFAVIAYISQSRTASVVLPSAESPGRIPLMLAHNILFYLYKFIWPVNPSPHYPFPEPFTLSQPMVLIGVLGTIVLLVVLLISLRWTRALLTGWLFFFLAILPAMGIIGFTPVIAADRFAYFPIIGFLLPLAEGLTHLWNRFASPLAANGVSASENWMNYGRAGILALALILAGLEAWSTRAYLVQWQNTESLYRYALRLAPNVEQLHNNLGLALARTGRASEAIAEYQAALQINPDYLDAHLNLGAEFADQGKLDEAIAEYEIVLRLKPDSATGHNNLGIALAQQGKLDEAEAHLRTALQIRPDYGEAHNNLGGALRQQGRLVEALAEYEAALKINPNDLSADANLRAAAEQKRQLDDGIRQLREALLSQPENIEWRLQLGELLELEGRFADAITEYRKVLEIDPSNSEAKKRIAALEV
jgi:protein O-mannosyl-transferase